MPTRNVCLAHWEHDGQFVEDHAALETLADPRNALDSPAGVNKALACLFRLTAQGKIPVRKAATLAYIGQLLISSLPQSRADQPALPAESRAEKSEDQPVLDLAPALAGSNGSNGDQQ
jgi:hypothetical protein